MDRPTKEFKTSGGHIVVFKTYATGREFNAIQSVYLSAGKINVVGKEVVLDNFSTDIHLKAKEKMIEVLVVSIDGATDSVLEKCLDLPANEYNEIVDFVSTETDQKKN